jgi:hypothetical protein
MRRLALALCTGLAAFAAGNAQAAICAVDDRPAATLLLPYFEHDYATSCTSGGGRDHSAVFSVHNASNTGQLARVTLWTRAGIPALDFYLYLHGRQSRRIALADILCRGVLPRSGSAWERSTRFGSSPNYTSCSDGSGAQPNVPPGYSTPLSVERRAELRRALTGKPDPDDASCAAPDAGDEIARGYLTIDDATLCSSDAPDSAQYLQGQLGHDNVWLGSWVQTGLAEHVAGGGPLIAIESAPPGFFAADAPTFYGRYHDFSGADRREPLPSTWSTAFVQGGNPARTADWIVWRETPRLTPSTALCNGTTAGGELPLESREQRAFDAGGNSQAAPQAAPAPIAFAAQRIPAQALESSSTVAFAGSRGLGYGNFADGTVDARLGQAWMAMATYVPTRFGDLVPALAMDSRCTVPAPADVRGPLAALPTVPGFLFTDGLED